MSDHALLSASSSHRWLQCPPSARLCEGYPDKGSDYSAEGTDAHSLCEFRVKQALGIAAEDPTESLSYYSEEMEDGAAAYATYIIELLEAAKKECTDPVILTEQHLDLSRFVREAFGTADCIVAADGTLHIVDYKFGRGVLVEAEGNPQLQLYALGSLDIFDGIYDISEVRMTIFQPRRSNISTCTMSKDELYRWAEETLKPAAELAFTGGGEFRCGEWCQFCKAKSDCRERADYNMELARYDFQLPPLLMDEDIEDILAKVDELVSWASDIKEYALQQAISGKEWTGWKLVEGRSNRKYINDTVVADVVEHAGFDPYERKVLGVTAMQKAARKIPL